MSSDKNNGNQGKPPEHAPAHDARDRDEIEMSDDDVRMSIDDVANDSDADRLIALLPDMPESELRQIVAQVRERNPARKRVKEAALAALGERIAELEQDRKSLAIELSSKSEYSAKIPLRPMGKQWGSFAGTVLLVAVLAWFGRASIEVNAHAESRSEVIMIAPEFAESMKASGTWSYMTDEERAEVDRAIKHGEGR